MPGHQVIQLNYNRSQSKTLVKIALEYSEYISQYYVTEHQIIAKTGLSFPRILWSYGEKLFIDFHETANEDTTRISVYSDKEVSVNIGANPEKVKREFLAKFDWLRNLDEENLKNEVHKYWRYANQSTGGNNNSNSRNHSNSQSATQQAQDNQVRSSPRQPDNRQRSDNQRTREQTQPVENTPQQNRYQRSTNQRQSHSQNVNQQNRQNSQNESSRYRSKQLQRERDLSSGSNAVLWIMFFIGIIFAIYFIILMATLP